MNKKWKTFEHNGLAFPPLYEHKNLTISINSKILNLTSDQEEMVYRGHQSKPEIQVHRAQLEDRDCFP